MSGTPKYCDSDISSETLARLQQERRQRAEEEARKRWEAEQREIRRRVESLRTAFSTECQLLLQRVNARAGFLYERDGQRLSERCGVLKSDIGRVQNELGLYRLESELRALDRDLAEAEAHKRRDDDEKKRIAELDKLRLRLEEVQRQVAAISKEDAARFDSDGGRASEQAIGDVLRSIDSGDLAMSQTSLARAIEAVKRHARTVEERREQWIQKRNAATIQVEELRAHVEGLRADTVLMRWHQEAIVQGEAALAQAAAALEGDRLDEPAAIAQKARVSFSAFIEDAGERQLEADKRDYIVQAIACALHDMNYFRLSDPHLAEYENPASAKLLETVNAQQQSINVSIPVSGQVIYTVGGHVITTTLDEDGKHLTACDEAVKILGHLAETVDQLYGVKLGEVCWDKKDPQDRDKTEENLPSAPKPQSRTA